MGGVRKRTTELTRELTSNPFFPLLFIGEATKTSAFYLVGEASGSVVAVSTVMAIVSVLGWLYTYDEVKWGLSKASEVAEDEISSIATESDSEESDEVAEDVTED